ncbi:MAG: bifunctional 4-hydroxy-2-oxoglutarate aldolase/2-dehydro-3-deoxy-phosphogluconate aldolase [Bacteroidetes bacterium]|nr:bifunctional 4-hydroxy-2-oxoglutarate aldolase/2-dehydro-3-deoxy-phosphogluconate aldolase [Bacteroidales bacterium]NJO68592.1 bifunctional 4-hydroxy-2-oxoglutarate aldolase/2-dehydro-3-deoxy-phosphogluconate aldolase [Bacteroidota bacterium]
MLSTTKETSFSWERFENMPIVGIVRGIGIEDFKHILPIYAKAGLTTIEVTMNTPDVEALIRYAVQEYSGVLNVGAGTVCNVSDLNNALDYGARFIVTPIINDQVITICVDRKIPIFPGAFTPSEIYKAWTLGAPIVKIYPAGNFGADYIKDVKAPLNKVRMMPTGGIGLNNMQSFLEVGADGFGIGSPLFDKSILNAKDWNALEKHFTGFVEIIEKFRNQK